MLLSPPRMTTGTPHRYLSLFPPPLSLSEGMLLNLFVSYSVKLIQASTRPQPMLWVEPCRVCPEFYASRTCEFPTEGQPEQSRSPQSHDLIETRRPKTLVAQVSRVNSFARGSTRPERIGYGSFVTLQVCPSSTLVKLYNKQ